MQAQGGAAKSAQDPAQRQLHD